MKVGDKFLCKKDYWEPMKNEYIAFHKGKSYNIINLDGLYGGFHILAEDDGEYYFNLNEDDDGSQLFYSIFYKNFETRDKKLKTIINK